MVDKYSELELEKCESPQQIDERLKEVLGVSFADFQQKLSECTVASATELVEDLNSMVPHGDYDLLLTDQAAMVTFLTTEAYKPEHWLMQDIGPAVGQKDIISFRLVNTAVGDGDVLEGFVYVSLQGKIKHAFVQSN